MVGNSVHGSAQTTTYGGDTQVIQKPINSNTIVCFAERPEGFPGLVYDAQFLVGSLRTKYDLR